MSDLTPCLFCGKEDLSFNITMIGKRYVFCWTCGAQGPQANTVKEAAEKWNTPGLIEEALKARISEMESTK